MQLKDLTSAGNSKLPRTTAIFNMCPATVCPSRALGMCQAINKKGKNVCYAMKAESGVWPNVLPYRQKQEKYWMKVSAEQFTNEFISLNDSKRNKFKALRFNESGDFKSQADVVKLEKISKCLVEAGVKVYIYTARKDLDYSKVKHTKILGSGFKKKGISGIFKYIESEAENDSGFPVCVGDCKVCSACLNGASRAIPRH